MFLYEKEEKNNQKKCKKIYEKLHKKVENYRMKRKKIEERKTMERETDATLVRIEMPRTEKCEVL